MNIKGRRCQIDHQKNQGVYVVDQIINYNSFLMSFTNYNPVPNSFYTETPSTQNYSRPPIPFPYSPEDVHFQMMALYGQNLYLQHQYLQQSYHQMLQQQQTWKEIQNQVKVEEPVRKVEHVYCQNLNEETDKCFQQTEAISRELFRKRINRIRKPKPQKNETKNIPKNYGKAIVSFIENNKQIVKAVLSRNSQMHYANFMNMLRSKKNKINSIADLRSFWLEGQDRDFPKIVRILSNIFLRHFSLEYIFNSRISNYSGHVKYRARLIEALRNPEDFTSIKQY